MQRRTFLQLASLAGLGLIAGDTPMTRRWLLPRGSGGSVTATGPTAVALTSSPYGGNNPWQVPGAYQHGGLVVGGFHNGSTGDVGAFTFDEATLTPGGPHTIHSAFQSPPDAHTSPTLHRRSSDGRIVALYPAHNSVPFNRRISTNSDDASAWGSATNLDSQLGGTGYTDVAVHELSNGSLLMVYRDEPTPGTDSRWCYSRSTDGGVSWSAQVVVVQLPGTRCYVTSRKDPNSDLVHFVMTNGASSGFTKLGHFRMDGITLARTKSDGSSIAAALPLAFGDVTEVYAGSGPVFMSTVAIDVSGHPVTSGWDDMDYLYCRWDGSTWHAGTFVNAGTGFSYNNDGNFQPWGIAVDDGNPDDVWLAVDTGGFPSVRRYKTSDLGASWSWRHVRAAGNEIHTIVPVMNPGRLRCYWGEGPWTHYETYSAGLYGAVAA